MQLLRNWNLLNFEVIGSRSFEDSGDSEDCGRRRGGWQQWREENRRSFRKSWWLRERHGKLYVRPLAKAKRGNSSAGRYSQSSGESKVQSSASGTSGGSWAAVTPEPQVKPKEPTTPRVENSMMWTSCSEKRTPGGTQVPDGPPPTITSMSPILRAKADLPKVPPMPEWLLQGYEIVDKNPQGFSGPVFGAPELHGGTSWERFCSSWTARCARNWRASRFRSSSKWRGFIASGSQLTRHVVPEPPPPGRGRQSSVEGLWEKGDKCSGGFNDETELSACKATSHRDLKLRERKKERKKAFAPRNFSFR